MEVVKRASVGLRGGHEVGVRFLRVAEGADRWIGPLVEIDLGSFVEATLTRAMAEVLVHHGLAFLLEVDGEVVGSCLCLRSWEEPDTVVLSSVGLLPAWRGRGLGLRMVSWLLEALSEEGVHALLLHVGSHNRRAVALYREMGFLEQSRGDPDPFSGEQSLLLRRELKGDVRVDDTPLLAQTPVVPARPLGD